MKKTYDSFEQIDQDLRIYRLQQKVAMESIKLSAQRVKTKAQPSNLVGGSVVSAGKMILGVLSSRAVGTFLIKLLKK